MIKRLYWFFRERSLNYQMHEIYMSSNPWGCSCSDCLHRRRRT